MIKFSIATAVALACVLSATQASAADFTGARIEAHVGYDSVSVDLSDSGFGNGSKGGVAYAIGAGYDFALSQNVILGVEVNADLSTVKLSASERNLFAEVKAQRDLSVLVRIGTKVSENALLYAKAGYANGRVAVTLRDSSSPGNNVDEAANADGIRGGIGLEYALGAKAYGKIEYQYTNYEAGLSRNQGLVGVGFRF